MDYFYEDFSESLGKMMLESSSKKDSWEDLLRSKLRIKMKIKNSDQLLKKLKGVLVKKYEDEVKKQR
jgi:hypothetical protein